ncbi:hypothetical protein [Roseateles sp. P5_E11]
MTNRELLELAAKAAGVPVEGWTDDDWVKTSIDADGTYSIWSPLKSDGDALRLAVKLHLDIMLRGPSLVQVFGTPGVDAYTFEDRGDDSIAATRRAIVRAAAQIGKG